MFEVSSFLFGSLFALILYVAKKLYDEKVLKHNQARLEVSLKEAKAREESQKLSDQVLADRLRALASTDSNGGDTDRVSTVTGSKDEKS